MYIYLYYNSTGNVSRTIIEDSKCNRIFDPEGWHEPNDENVCFELIESNLKEYMKEVDIVNLENIERDREQGILR